MYSLQPRTALLEIYQYYLLVHGILLRWMINIAGSIHSLTTPYKLTELQCLPLLNQYVHVYDNYDVF